MIVGGIVRRLVTPSHPGDPALDDPASSVQFRVEYLAAEFDPAVWTTVRDNAFFFSAYSDAGIRAKALGEHCHPVVCAPPNQESIPEELRPLPEMEAPAPPRILRMKKRKSRVVVPVLSPRRDWVTETYG